MYKSKSPQRIIIPSPSIDNDGPPSAITAKKRKPAFMTQSSKKSSGEELLLVQHNEFVNYIGGLETKIQKIIESHDSQFLLAYKNHLNRVRKEMQELEIKASKETNSLTGQTQRIQTLQKELIIFREESLKLFDKMTEKQKQIDVLKMQVYELQTQQKFSKRTIADLMKRNKHLEALVKEFNLNKSQLKQCVEKQQSTEKRTSISFLEVNSLKKYSSQQKRTSRIAGKTDYSFFYKNNDVLNNNESGKDSRPTTTDFRSKRNSISIQNYTAKSINDYFAKNLASNFRQT